MWTSLIPLILGSALVPIEIVITIMLLGSPSRVRAAGAWVGGMVAARLAQGVVFGMILHWGERVQSDRTHGWFVSSVLLVVAILFFVLAAREFVSDDDPDAPPPKWMKMLSSVTPVKAFLIGVGVIAVALKFWVFTLGAIGVIGAADLGRAANLVTYLLFVLLVVSPHLVIVGVALIMPGRSKALLNPTLRWLQDNNRVIMIVLGLVFGTWFLSKALSGMGVL
jgi:hypothetical protein